MRMLFRSQRISILAGLLLVGLLWHLPSHADGQEIPWVESSASVGPVLPLYFFWSRECPHCQEALPFVEGLAQRHAWLRLYSLELNEHVENRTAYQAMAERFGEQARSVPAFFFCGTMLVGYDGADSTGSYLEEATQACHARVSAGEPIREAGRVYLFELPLVGQVDMADFSLPVMTVLIAGLDAFNPCAFFVLLFLLSLLVHARNRRRMLLIGTVFVFFSGLFYFLFMAAWLNAFLLFGQLRWVTSVAGAVAVVMALINLKDYWYTGMGPSLSIPAEAKPGLFRRIRGLLQADHLPALLLGTVTLAMAANSYELLCTSGLPMIYTRLLTLETLPTSVYYAYLLAYNVIYVIPLALIVVLFSASLGSRKLQAHEGRLLKLLSGLMMLGLGLMLLFAPAQLSNILVAGGLIAVAISLTALAALLEKYRTG